MTKTPINKESLFEQYLVPTGQVLELTLLLVPSATGSQRQVRALSNSLFEPLNLAAAYAANVSDPTLLQPLAESLDRFRAALVAAFKPLAAPQGKTVASLFKDGAVKLSTRQSLMVNKELVQLFASADNVAADLYGGIGYVSPERSTWLRQFTAGASVLTRNGRVNAWRTFVRNCSWQDALRVFGANEYLPPSSFLNNRFSSRVGIEHAKELWAKAFTESHVAKGSAGPEDGTHLPHGVKVTSTALGQLEVRAQLDPRKGLPAALAKHLRTKVVVLPKALRDLLAVREFSCICSYLQVPAVVEEATQWLQTQQASGAEAVKQVEEWQASEIRNAVVEKLNKNFSADEQKWLAQVFAEKATSGTAV